MLIFVCAPFNISLIKLYFIMILTMIVVTIIRIFIAILFSLNYVSRLSVTKQLWFCKCANPWMFPFNMDVLQGSFRLCNWLSWRRLVLWINHLPPACWSTLWKSTLKQQLGCRFDIMDNISSFYLYFDIRNYICLDTSYHFSALSLLKYCSLFFQVLLY